MTGASYNSKGAPAQPRRMVILHHRFDDDLERQDHWDVMIETESDLLTWALAEKPRFDKANWNCDAKRLTNHRRRYLDYEGSVSGGRGHVLRVMAVDAQVQTTDEAVEASFDWQPDRKVVFVLPLVCVGETCTVQIECQGFQDLSRIPDGLCGEIDD